MSVASRLSLSMLGRFMVSRYMVSRYMVSRAMQRLTMPIGGRYCGADGVTSRPGERPGLGWKRLSG